MTSSEHYALVPCGNGGSNPLFVQTSSENKKGDPRSELIDLYQTYADLYPNPRLIEEMRMRDMLLQASSAAKSASDSNKTKSTKQTGFFARWFGRSNDSDAPEKSETKQAASIDPLIYTDMDNGLDDGSLCGTMNSIDLSCIPTEVYSQARFHLASTRTRREQPNALSEGIATTGSSTLVVVGLGEIAEFSTSDKPRISKTSDQQELLDYADATQEYDLHYVRGTVLAPHCIAVSWGFMDGIIVIYRRIQFDKLDYGWTAVWMLGPSDQVLENMSSRELFHDEQDHPGSPLLRISECIPLQVETGEQHEPTVLTLALARLGGYIELIPIPQGIWNGAVLRKDNHKMSASPRRHRKVGQHYSGGKPIESPPNTLALTTAHCHVDIISLQAMRTSVTADSHWDDNAFPNSPPSEYIVCASGMSQEGYETISFWATSTIFSESPDPLAGIAVQLHSTLIEVISAETGPDVTVFATPGIMKRWRVPRNIQVSSDDASKSEAPLRHADDGITAVEISTISTAAPIVSKRFVQRSNGLGRPFLALLDWNGGVSVLDCAVLERLAAQTVNQEEYDLYHNADDLEPFPLVTCLTTRGQFANALKTHETTKGECHQSVVNIRNLSWMIPTDLPKTELEVPYLVLMMNESRKLVIVSVGEKLSVASVLFPGSGATMKMCQRRRLVFVSRGGWKDHGFCLKYFSMQQLEPLAIIRSLARDCKFEDVIQAASKLPYHDQERLSDTVEQCHLQLWKRKRETKWLQGLQNAAVVVHEVLHACFSYTTDLDLTFESLRVACQFAIAKGCNSLPLQEHIVKIEAFVVKLGTFELLCQLYSAQPSLVQFRKMFQDVPIARLAKRLAQRGELSALTIVVFRHKVDIGESILFVLHQIPVSLDPLSFAHLLPVASEKEPDTFFNPLDSCTEGAIHWSNMPLTMLDWNGTQIVLNSCDERRILCYLRNGSLFQNASSAVAAWTLERAKMMQTLVGNIRHVVSLCELGLRCSVLSREGEKPSSSEPSAQRLYEFWRRASSLQRLLLDGVTFSVGDSCLFSICTDDFLSMDLGQVIHMVFQGQGDTEQKLAKCANILQPLISNAVGPQKQEQNANFDSSIVSYCIGLLRRCCKADANGQAVERWFEALQKAIAVCVAIANASRTCIPKSARLIKEKTDLVRMVLSAMHLVANALDRSDVPQIISRDALASFWAAYETIPVDVLAGDRKGGLEEYLLLSEEIKVSSKALVGMEIVAAWPGCRPFAFYSQLCHLRTRSCTDMIATGVDAVARMCQSFLGQLRKGLTSESRSDLLQDLLSDVILLNRACFQGNITIKAVLADHLVPCLLKSCDFDVLASYIGGQFDVVDRDLIKRAILDFFEEAVFSNSEGGFRSIEAATECQDIVGAVFIEILPAFRSLRRYLDASHFINTAIFVGIDDVEPVSPAVVRRTLPLDLIESVLEEVPESVTCGSSQWIDKANARNANAVLRLVFDESKQGSLGAQVRKDPVLPGGAIFHLATILGLDDINSALIVKCIVIRHAQKEGLHGAAAAICRTLFRDVDEDTVGKETIALAKLGAVASIVNDECYSDVATRVELSRAALKTFSGQVNRWACSGFESIVRASASLDLLSSRFVLQQQHMPTERQAHLLSRPLARLYGSILTDYNADLHKLFLELRNQVSESTVHDALMNALGRFVLYWCVSVSNSLKPRVFLCQRTDARDILALGCAFILHIPSSFTSTECVDELRTIAAVQAETIAAQETFGSCHGSYVPDAQVVKRLTERGYTGNAACRAACATRNQSYDDALSWAVAHTLDDGINLPVLNLRAAGQKLRDDYAIQELRQALITTNRRVNHPQWTASSLKMHLKTWEDISTRSGASAVQHNRKNDVESKIPDGIVSSETMINSKNGGIEKQPTSNPNQRLVQSALSKPGPPVPGNLQERAIRPETIQGGGAIFSTPLNRETISKTTLLQPGTIASSKDSRTKVKPALVDPLNPRKFDDRKRLIEAGRSLFRQTRMKGLSLTSQAHSAPGPLRSKSSATAESGVQESSTIG